MPQRRDYHSLKARREEWRARITNQFSQAAKEAKVQAKYVHLNGKEYTVLIRSETDISIHVSWERIVPSTCYSAHPTYNTATRDVSLGGRLGRKILKTAGIKHPWPEY